MNPYAISDTEIALTLAAMEPDENGVLPDNIDEIEQHLADLIGERYDRCEWLCKGYANAMAESAAIKIEKQRLADRQKKAEEKAQRILDFMSKYLGEGKRQFGAFVFSSKKTPATIQYSEGMTEDKLITLLREINVPYVTSRTTYSLDKKNLKDAIKLKQIEIPGVTLEQGVSWSIK